ncbi:BcpO-related WXXGXW repeat protein [Ramlibacter sp. G-1-2-2]|uniref:BcpO-related WXXGXW repeat protein n=1 Tax=Ramlibacter agri TaxID=2728837 RepID=A0A848HB30_9BURK|nr:YXWGXW repeat-containing protein [Ramlibacter agri]NML46690.1 BcpO-related WXXGXW repeat protein [Ramlibacter agri]
MGSKKTWIVTAAAALAAASALLAAPAQAAGVYVEIAPPAPRVEAVPQPRHGQSWVPGHWEWRRHQYVWAPGYYVAMRPGYRYAEPHWVQVGGRWSYEPGRWERAERDRDHDGVPDRFDRHPDNPHRS